MIGLLQLPAFVLVVYMLYWSMPLAALFLHVKPWKLIGRRSDVFQWWAAGSEDPDDQSSQKRIYAGVFAQSCL
jgi:hypothetical protein